MGREATMPSLTIRNIPEDLHAKLEADAIAHGRSLDKEVLLRLAVSVVLAGGSGFDGGARRPVHSASRRRRAASQERARSSGG